MNVRVRTGWLSFGVLAALASALPVRAEDAPVQATWRKQEFTYHHSGFITAYVCDSVGIKIRAILVELGAHPSTKVTATGCSLTRPSHTFVVLIDAPMPVPAAEGKPTLTAAEQSKQELLKRLGQKSEISQDEFPAAWKRVALSRITRLDLRPTDCELMQGLRDHVLPKLGIKVIKDRMHCTPNQISMTMPQLTVSALTAVKSPDQKPQS